MIRRYELSDAQWARIAHLLPGKAGDPGRHAVDNRLFVHGVLWILRSGARWSDLPPRYGQDKTVHRRFGRWADKDVWEKVFAALNRRSEQRLRDARCQPRQSPPAGRDGQKGGDKTRRWGVPEED